MNVKIEIPVLDRDAAHAKGFDNEDIAAWVDVMAAWAYEIGAEDVSFGSGEREADLSLHLIFPSEPSDLMVGDICMRQRVGSHDHPMRLENFDAYKMRPILRGYRRMQRLFLGEREKATSLLKDFSVKLDALISQRPYYPVDRMGEITDAVKFAAPRREEPNEQFFGEDEGKHS